MRALLLLLLLLLALTACSGSERPLQFNLGNEVVQLDWNRSIDINSAVILDNVMEGLTSYVDSLHGSGAELLRPMPALAFSWSVSEGGRLYRFHLRSGVFWSDGVELSAQHFVDSWERLLNPATGTANSYQLFEVENAAAYASGKLKNFSQVGVRARDAYTLEVRLRRPVPYFLHLVASPSTFPIRKELIMKFGENWADPEHLVTLGPYRISEWSQGERIVLRAFPGYYGNHPKISTVICRMITEPLTAYTFFENSDLDIIPRDLPPSLTHRLQSHPDYRSGPKLGLSYLMFNLHRPPFDSAAKRRAFVEALDRALLAGFFEGSQSPFSSWIPPGLIGHEPELGVVASGKENNSLKGASVVLRFSGGDSWNLLFQSLQRTLMEKLQLKVKLEQVESRDFGKFLGLFSGPGRPRAEALPHLLLLGWVADYPDPHSFMNLFTSASENNYMRWKNPAYDQLVENAVSTAEEATRKRSYLEAQKILLEKEVVLMPLFLNSHQALVRSSLQGVNLNVLDKWYFKNVNFSDGEWRGFGASMLRRLRFSRAGSRGSS